MPRSNILVVVVDGLRASALGAYGNTTYPTPALDRFAADSLLLDWCYAPSADLNDIYRALWQSIHPARSLGSATNSAGRKAGVDPHASLPTLLTQRGYQTTLITDDPQLVSFAEVANFHECMQLASPSETLTTGAHANDISQTELARIFIAVSEIIAHRQSSPQLVWAHARGMYGPWDAPLELQQSLSDENDPPPVESVTPPDFAMRTRDESDEAFRYSCAYAAQAIVLDDCWHSLIEAMNAACCDAPWLVMLIGARGYPLGEHRRVGGVDSRLYTEQLHVPWLIRFPDARGRLARSGQLASHLDVLPTLLDWIDDDSNLVSSKFDGLSTLPLATAASTPWRDALLSATSDGNYTIRTPSWCLRADTRRAAEPNDMESASATPTIPPAELFVRPDDRWEANDVAKLCPEVVEELYTAAADTLRRLSRGEPLPHTAFPSEAGATPI